MIIMLQDAWFSAQQSPIPRCSAIHEFAWTALGMEYLAMLTKAACTASCICMPLDITPTAISALLSDQRGRNAVADWFFVGQAATATRPWCSMVMWTGLQLLYGATCPHFTYIRSDALVWMLIYILALEYACVWMEWQRIYKHTYTRLPKHGKLIHAIYSLLLKISCPPLCSACIRVIAVLCYRLILRAATRGRRISLAFCSCFLYLVIGLFYGIQ